MPDTLINVQNCSDTSCGTWDEIFCICNLAEQLESVCAPATLPTSYPYDHYDTCYPGYDPSYVDNIANLLGIYSTTCTDASTLPATGPDSATWSNIDNAKQDDGTYASISPTPLERIGGKFQQCDHGGSEYIMLTGFGFNIPFNSKIWGIALGLKGYTTRSQPNSVNGVHCWNLALVQEGGTAWYRCDPATDGFLHDDPPIDPYCGPQVVSTPPYPATDCLDISVSNAVPFYAQPFGWAYFVAGGVINSLTSLTSSVEIAPVSLFRGTQPGCNSLAVANQTITQKDMWIPAAKSLWTAAEINAPDFGIAFSLYGDNQHNISPGTPSINIQTYFLDCVGVCVYYTLTGPTPSVPTGNPLAECIPTAGCS